MKQYTINDFFAGKVDIRCKNNKQALSLLKECDKRGVVWNNNLKATSILHLMPVLEMDFFGNGRLTQSNGHDERNVVDFDKINFQKCKHYRIVIDCDGDTTRAIMTIDGKEIKGAVARRNPEDKFNWRKGAELAFDRLWNSQRKAGEKPEVREVKRWAEPGEYIRIVMGENDHGENYCDGDILPVMSYYEGERTGWVNAKGANVVIDPDEYVVLEGYRP